MGWGGGDLDLAWDLGVCACLAWDRTGQTENPTVVEATKPWQVIDNF